MQVYLAGPEVFLPDAKEIGRRKRDICERYALTGLYPLDNEIDPPKAGRLSQAIFEGNIRMIAEADLIIANLTPFRGVSADAGTIYEVGHAFALGKPIYGYSHDPAITARRVIASARQPAADGRVYADDGLSVEDFDLADNLMIVEAIAASGGRFIAAEPGCAFGWRDLDLFEACVSSRRPLAIAPLAVGSNRRRSSRTKDVPGMTTYDVLIIGAGPGGYVSAIRAAQLGFKTAVVDREHLGGICLNWGCIPTKALLRSAEIFHYFQHPGEYGLTAEKVGFDVGAIVKRSRGVSAKLNGGVGMLLKKNKVDVIWGEASVDSVAKGNQPGQITVKESKRAEPPKGAKGAGSYSAKHIIVATGARPRAIPGIEPDKKQIWTYYEAMVPESMPKSLLVMGSGAIGIEFASFYRTMGAEVTVIELLPQILPVEDAEIAGMARKRFEKQGIKILTGAKVTKVEKAADSVHRHDRDRRRQVADAQRRKADLGGRRRRQHRESRPGEARGGRSSAASSSPTGSGARTCPASTRSAMSPGPPMLAHKAEHEGVICIETIKGLHTHPMDKAKIPGCTYCQPQIASVGLTEAKAKEQGFFGQGRPLPVRRQRQGHRPRRAGRHGQDGVRTPRPASSSAPTWSAPR